MARHERKLKQGIAFDFGRKVAASMRRSETAPARLVAAPGQMALPTATTVQTAPLPAPVDGASFDAFGAFVNDSGDARCQTLEISWRLYASGRACAGG